MESFESAIVPVLPLKDQVVFPGAITPLFVIRPASLIAIDAALRSDKRLFLVCQRDISVELPDQEDLHEVGTVAEILQVLRVPDGSAKILVEGLYPARIVQFMSEEEHLRSLLVRMEINGTDNTSAQAFLRSTLKILDEYVTVSSKIPEEIVSSMRGLQDALSLIFAVANYSGIKTEDKQKILEANVLEDKFVLLQSALEGEIEIAGLEDQIVSQVKTQIGRSQREYFLNEQLKAIQGELGMGSDEHAEIEELARQIEKCGMPEEAKAKTKKELGRLSRMAPLTPEATVARTYIEWMIELPWTKRTEDRIDLNAARVILDADHHGLEKVKERIVEYLAVAKLSGEARGPILCFVGPPGVGKTSLARSIARCIGREFVRISLGGVRDEAEIRGHRRTYVGAMPGKIIQSIKKSATVNPVFLLDEIDKMSSDFRGDPAAALLEVLDPEQNVSFNDHYLEVDYDLSRVMFIATANTTNGIPLPLQDRMEIIRISGYTDAEKLMIAKKYLVPRAVKNSGLKKNQVRLEKGALERIIQGYTKESGVRGLEKEISSLCRKIAMKVASAEEGSKPAAIPSVTSTAIPEYLGPEKFSDSALDHAPEIGNVIGLAWTEAGGEVLQVEARTMSGKGNLILTGKLGDVMKESATTALSYIRSRAAELSIDPEFYQNRDVHIHLPEGAIPKDGPSAGITLATALASVLSGRAVRQDIAMTGEMTLRGKVLKIGGLKEKVLAAWRNGIRRVIIPAENLSEQEEIPADIRRRMVILPVSDLMQVLELVFAPLNVKKSVVKSQSRGYSARSPR